VFKPVSSVSIVETSKIIGDISKISEVFPKIIGETSSSSDSFVKAAQENFKLEKLSNISDIINFSNFFVSEALKPQRGKNFLVRFINKLGVLSACKYNLEKAFLLDIEVIKDAYGKILAGFGYSEKDGKLFISHLVVDNSKRNNKEIKNILIKIGKRIKNIAEEKNVSEIECMVQEEKDNLIKLYKKAGFTVKLPKEKNDDWTMNVLTKDFGKKYF